MKTFFHNQKAYLFIMLAYFLIGLASLFFIEKGDLVLYFSEHRTGFWNDFFLLTNHFGEAWAFILGFFALLFFTKIRYALFVPVIVGSTALLSMILKEIFHHLRPKLWLEQRGIMLNVVPDIYINSGYTSFPSGHTFAAFAIFGYLALVSKSSFFKILFAICAILGGLARVYLSQHFLEDILFGGFLGMTLAILVFILQKQLNHENRHWWNHVIFKKTRNKTI